MYLLILNFSFTCIINEMAFQRFKWREQVFLGFLVGGGGGNPLHPPRIYAAACICLLSYVLECAPYLTENPRAAPLVRIQTSRGYPNRPRSFGGGFVRFAAAAVFRRRRPASGRGFAGGPSVSVVIFVSKTVVRESVLRPSRYVSKSPSRRPAPAFYVPWSAAPPSDDVRRSWT